MWQGEGAGRGRNLNAVELLYSIGSHFRLPKVNWIPSPLSAFSIAIMPTNLFPISHGRISCGWTTSTTIPPPNPLILCVPLQDVALGAHKDWKRTPRPIVTPPSGNGASERHQLPPESAWEVVYPAGSINPGGGIKGGTSFYISGPRSFKEELETACEVMFSYRVMFMDGWDARLGGKLPGAC
jgi:hypothetical protein